LAANAAWIVDADEVEDDDGPDERWPPGPPAWYDDGPDE
jgi:hypothetical protein